VAPFFLQNFVNVIVEKHMGLRCSNVPDFLVKSIYSLIWRRQKKNKQTGFALPLFPSVYNIFDEAREVNGVVSLAAQFVRMAIAQRCHQHGGQGVNNVVSCSPSDVLPTMWWRKA
jgi:hypothetical protein